MISDAKINRIDCLKIMPELALDALYKTKSPKLINTSNKPNKGKSKCSAFAVKRYTGLLCLVFMSWFSMGKVYNKYREPGVPLLTLQHHFQRQLDRF